MSFFWENLQRPGIQQWAGVLLHFIWQGCLVAALTSIMLRMIRRDNARRRYLVTLSGLGCLTVLPIVTWIAVSQVSELDLAASTAISSPAVFARPVTGEVSSQGIELNSSHEPASFESVTPRQSSDAESLSTWRRLQVWPSMSLLRVGVFSIWCVFQLFLGGRLLVGSVLLWRIQILATDVSQDVQEIAEKTARRIGLRRVPRILSSALVSDAAAAGFLRSFVLLPASWLTDMSPAMLEAVLAHEFSHVRRYDVWVNLLQRTIETVFFYHPAVWWLTKQIRIERELCCDSEASVAIGCATTFAKTLEQAARYRAGCEFSFTSGLRGDQMSLLSRVNRVLNKSVPPPRNSRWPIGIVALCVPVLLAMATPEKQSVAQSPQKSISISEVSGLDNKTTEGEQSGAVGVLGVIPKKPPTELAKVTLPDYVIEPPDVLLIEGLRLVSKEPYKLRSKDVLQIVVLGTQPERPIAGQYVIQEGKVKLGPGYGAVKLEGLTIDEAEKAVRTKLLEELAQPSVTLAVFHASGEQFITGEHLVGPDGTVSLGKYGQVFVAGKTVAAAKQEVEKHLSTRFRNPEISLEVFVYNSKFFYLIVEGEAESDQITRIPITGNETVLDAIAQVGGIRKASKKTIWLSRPSRNGLTTERILPVDFEAITRGAVTDTNYQLLPGDRLFVSDTPPQGLPLMDAEATAKLFSEMVKQRQYSEAIGVAEKLHATQPKSPVATALMEQSKLLRKELEFNLQEEMKETTELISQIRDQRMEELKIRTALRQKVKVEFDNVPIKTVVQTLSESLGINIFVDVNGLAYEGVTLDTPLTLTLKHKVPASSLLALVFEPYRLGVFVEDGVLKVTSRDAAVGQVNRRTYKVDDVVGFRMLRRGKDGKVEEDWFGIDSLVNLIEVTIAPDHWNDVGGPGSVQAFGDDRLVVSCGQSVHTEIQELLVELKAVAKRTKRFGDQTIQTLQRFPEGFKRL